MKRADEHTPASEPHSGIQGKAGAVIFPVIPSFYNQPTDPTEMARQFVCRVLAHVGLPLQGAYFWKAED